MAGKGLRVMSLSAVTSLSNGVSENTGYAFLNTNRNKSIVRVIQPFTSLPTYLLEKVANNYFSKDLV